MINSIFFWDKSFIKFKECFKEEIPFNSIFDDEYEIVEKFLNLLKPNDKILDFGVGIGRNSFPLAQKGYEVEICDISKEAIKFCVNYSQKNGIKVLPVLYENNKIDVKNSRYDAIIAWSVLNYVTYDDATLLINEFRRVLKKNGLLIICFDSEENSNEIDKDYEILEDGTLSYNSYDKKGMLYRKYKNSEIMKLFCFKWNLLFFSEKKKNILKIALFEVI